MDATFPKAVEGNVSRYLTFFPYIYLVITIVLFYKYEFEYQVIGNGLYKDVCAYHRLYVSLCDFI